MPQPLVVRRTVAFASAVDEGEITVEGVRAVLVDGPEEALRQRAAGVIPVVVDPAGDMVRVLRPTVLIDAIMAKRNTGARISDAPVVIALGPGFYAGRDAHAVVETKRGHYLERVIREGAALPNTGEPGPVDGYTFQRVLRVPAAGIFAARRKIGEVVAVGDVVGFVGEHPVRAEISGVLRGLIGDGCPVEKGLKIGDVDPRGQVDYCFTISEKARAVAGGVLEAVLHLLASKKDITFFHNGCGEVC